MVASVSWSPGPLGVDPTGHGSSGGLSLLHLRTGMGHMSAEFTPATKAAAAERSAGLCEVCGSARAFDYHHRRPRGMGSTKRADTASLAACLHICRHCHTLIESHRNLATLLGWLVPSTFDPASQPVLRRGEWVRLTEDGGIAEEAA